MFIIKPLYHRRAALPSYSPVICCFLLRVYEGESAHTIFSPPQSLDSFLRVCTVSFSLAHSMWSILKKNRTMAKQ